MKGKFLIFVFSAVAVALGSGVQLSAQGIARMTEELSRPDPATGAAVEVTVADDAAAAVRAADLGSGRTSVVVAYGVRIYSDSSQDGHENAKAAKARFDEMYPGTGSEISYEIPSFRVTAGRYVDRVDAVALCGRVLAQFKDAFVVQSEEPVSAVIARDREKIEPDIVIQE